VRVLAVLLVSAAAITAIAAQMTPAPGAPGKGAAAPYVSGESVAAYVTKEPAGFRDWKWIASAHEEGKLNSLGAVLGNSVAIKAYREKTIPFPDGTVLAALHYSAVHSAENDKIFGQPQSIVPGAPTNIQFMVKDSKKYAATGGWGFGHFSPDGKPADGAFMKPCYPCHAQFKAHDMVFTEYAP